MAEIKTSSSSAIHAETSRTSPSPSNYNLTHKFAEEVTTTSLCPATTIAQSYHYPPQNTMFIPSTTTTPQSASLISAYKPTTTTTFTPFSLFIL
ncbi:hypothetical protein ACSBR2_029250 [Camellia fascicularis]